ncbi:MAG TPA: serine/threonine-protein kinase [Myxococcales bacterium]|nr:serine/threonine-protein kinase [Myxococcales bacterium]
MTTLDDSAVAHLQAVVREPDLSGTRYELVGVAGSGGMGTVYIVHDTQLDRRVALKMLDVLDVEMEARLRREAVILARLEHPGIVPVHDVGRLCDGRAYYTMKLVEGERLDRYAERGPPVQERLRVFLRIADAVAFAHSRAVLHRDLKPQNVMIGSFGQVLVLDWGLAKVLPDGGSRTAAVELASRPARRGTGEGAVLGTPGFMAPEQERGGSSAADARTDVYSLGALLAWIAGAAAPAAIRAIARKAMAAEPADRYGSAAELARDVERFLDGSAVAAYPEGALRRAARLARRHRVAIGIVLAYLIGRALILLLAHR